MVTCWNHTNAGLKHGRYWKFPVTSLQLSRLESTHATGHACRGGKMVDQRLRIFPPSLSSVAQVLLNAYFPFMQEDLRRGFNRFRGHILDETESF